MRVHSVLGNHHDTLRQHFNHIGIGKLFKWDDFPHPIGSSHPIRFLSDCSGELHMNDQKIYFRRREMHKNCRGANTFLMSHLSHTV